ncbi:Glyoxalase/Bleomycin resistance protein/Dihydroxybiphenyl dioxygenase [Microdochium trichocladiopsis]|uniref:Glyoxalase/Bleomycin resistance protein/Dihydroxybiphenyl dioxygenase n=1 Tax=Microdochium trichocladiopsis TaxID=1682393 RepID=A0A9P8YDN0_9PEZI|nr:Glyoxalase/Bleomycin resistance protein/Dihydroxybiphenyl dioxygenase [Microdochium trichocladiopsis]KAH7037071.1 Glyoxalase/Bleomycin resistance protein/Dihydroxybiphenyl dioxygenase [Microdochium trichocladiopsis]
MPPNLALNHIALSVHDVEVVTAWYTSVLGFRLAKPIRHVKREETPDANLFRIYGARLHEAKVALLLAGNGVGFEIFEFVRPRFEPAHHQQNHLHQGTGSDGDGDGYEFAYEKQGIFHVCVTDEDVEGRVEKIVQAGGKLQGEIVTADPKRGIKAAYVRDPWGNMLEVLSVGFDVFTAE